MIINHNLGAMNANRQMGINQSNASKSMEKLSSGLRINKSGDGAAGLAISEKMRGQIRGLDQASANSQDAISLIQTGEGALNETHSILQRMRELSVQASNDTNTTGDRDEIQKEVNQLTSEINRIGSTTEFNKRKLLDGSIKVGTGAAIDTTEANKAVITGDSLSNIKLATNSKAASGAYVAKIENLGGEDSFDVGSSQDPNGAASLVNKVSGTDTQLASGIYSVEVKLEDAMTIKAGTFTPDTGVTDINALTVAADATLVDDAAYKIEITKNVTQTATDVNTSGLSTLTMDAADKPKDAVYKIETSAGLKTVADAVGTAKADGVIGNIAIDKDSTFAETGAGAQIQITKASAVTVGATAGITDVQATALAGPADGDYTLATSLGVTGISNDVGTATGAGQLVSNITIKPTSTFVETGVAQIQITGQNNLTANNAQLTTLGASNMQIDSANTKAGAYTVTINAAKDVTVSNGTTNVTIAAGDLVVGANNFTNADFDITLDLVASGSLVAGTANATVSADYTIKLVNDSAGIPVTLASTTFGSSSNAGVNSVTVGDLTMDIDFSKLNSTQAAGSTYDADAIGFNIGKTVTVTSVADPTETASKTYAAGATVPNDAFTLNGGNITMDVVANALVAGVSTTIHISNDQPSYTISLVDDAGGVGETTFGSTTFSVSATGGVNNVKVGDISMDVNYAKLYADSIDAYDGDAVSLDVTKNVTITDMADDTITGTLDATAVLVATPTAIALKDTDNANAASGTFKLNIDTASFINGTTLYTTVDTKTDYDVQLKTSAGVDVAGSTEVNLTEAYLANPANAKNLNLGNGVTIDLDTAALATAAAGTSSTTFTADKALTNTAVLQNSTGANIGMKYTMPSSGTLDMGSGASFEFDNTVKQGDYNFTVQKNTTEDDFRMTLTITKDGVLDTLINQKAIDPNAKVDLGNGISIDTAVNMDDGDKATFEVIQGTKDDSLTMQIGANNGQNFSVDINDMRAAAIKISGDEAGADTGVAGASYVATENVTNGTNNVVNEFALDLSDAKKATAAIEVIDNAIQKVSAERSKLGAFQNRLEHTIANLGTASENMTSAESRIRDVDMAKEMSTFSKNNILSQAAQAMLAQANQQPQQVLQLLR